MATIDSDSQAAETALNRKLASLGLVRGVEKLIEALPLPQADRFALLRGGATAERIARAYTEMLSGYRQDAADVLSMQFPVGEATDMVVLRGVPFSSLCEHHLLPFTGHVTLGYLPRMNLVGLSKLARLVDVYARRLQLQERMTHEIANALCRHLDPIGSGVVVEASHSCMSCRGVEKRGVMVTSCLLGAFREPAVRAEFLSLAPGFRG